MQRVVIIGGGIAGLACAHALSAAGIDWVLLESSDACGGRVRTDVVGGFRLDRGFQVYLTAYRAIGEALDERALAFREFESGALVFDGRGFVRVAHPLRHPAKAAAGALASPATALGLAPLAPLAVDALRGPVPPAAPAGESTQALLSRLGVGRGVVDGFLRAFFGGVFLDRSLGTDAGQFRFTLGHFVRGPAAVPAAGMGAIPAQLAAALPAGRVRLRCAAASVRHDARGVVVRTADGGEERGDAVVIAADMTAARALDPRIPARPWCATYAMHWACPVQDVPNEMRAPVLVLDGTGEGPVNHAACMSSVAPSYAPAGQALIDLSIVDLPREPEPMDSLIARVRAQMERWFGSGATRGWRLLRTDRVLRALPRQHAADVAARCPVRLDARTFVAGDHVADGSLDGAWRSGLAAAAAALGSFRE
jgi:phytoene dehydrogenase-like protein